MRLLRLLVSVSGSTDVGHVASRGVPRPIVAVGARRKRCRRKYSVCVPRG